MTLHGTCPSIAYVLVFAANGRVLSSVYTLPGRFTFYPPDAPALRLRYGCDYDGDGVVAAEDVATVDPWYPSSPTAAVLQLPEHDADPAYPFANAARAITRPRVASDMGGPPEATPRAQVPNQAPVSQPPPAAWAPIPPPSDSPSAPSR